MKKTIIALFALFSAIGIDAQSITTGSNFIQFEFANGNKCRLYDCFQIQQYADRATIIDEYGKKYTMRPNDFGFADVDALVAFLDDTNDQICGNGGLALCDDCDAANELQVLTQNGDTITLSNGGGDVIIDHPDFTETVTFLSIVGDTISYINEDGTIADIVINHPDDILTSINIIGDTIIRYIDEKGIGTDLVLPDETVTTLIDNNGIITYTNENGDDSIINIADSLFSEIDTSGWCGAVIACLPNETLTTITSIGDSILYVDELGNTNVIEIVHPDDNHINSNSVTGNDDNLIVTITDEEGNSYVDSTSIGLFQGDVVIDTTRLKDFVLDCLPTFEALTNQDGLDSLVITLPSGTVITHNDTGTEVEVNEYTNSQGLDSIEIVVDGIIQGTVNDTDDQQITSDTDSIYLTDGGAIAWPVDIDTNINNLTTEYIDSFFITTITTDAGQVFADTSIISTQCLLTAPIDRVEIVENDSIVWDYFVDGACQIDSVCKVFDLCVDKVYEQFDSTYNVPFLTYVLDCDTTNIYHCKIEDPEARVTMTDPDNEQGTFAAAWDFQHETIDDLTGECISIDVKLIDTLTGLDYVYETLTGLYGDDISTFSSTVTTANESITDHSTGIVATGDTTITNKFLWAVASGNNGANASKMIFKAKIGGVCTGNTETLLPQSTNADNFDEACKIVNFGFDNNVPVPANVIDESGDPNIYEPLLVGGIVSISDNITRTVNNPTCGTLRLIVDGNYTLSSLTIGGVTSNPSQNCFNISGNNLREWFDILNANPLFSSYEPVVYLFNTPSTDPYVDCVERVFSFGGFKACEGEDAIESFTLTNCTNGGEVVVQVNQLTELNY